MFFKSETMWFLTGCAKDIRKVVNKISFFEGIIFNLLKTITKRNNLLLLNC